MSLIQPQQSDIDKRPSQLNLSSNNPFRNRTGAASPSSAGSQPHSPFDPPPRPVSRNPFLDVSAKNVVPPPIGSANNMATTVDSAPKPRLTGNAAELFDNLTLSDEPASRPSNGMRPPQVRSKTSDRLSDRAPPPYQSQARPRGENIPPRAPPGHRPSRSQEEALRARKPGQSSRSSRPTEELDIFADPDKSSSRRARRNSDSSVMSKKIETEEDKRRAERRRRERRHRDREGKESISKSSTSKKPRNLDIIDKLDVTSIYGTGLFHHDGPFDACNPHRNRQGSRRAPMQAFPEGSINNTLGGSGPLNKRPDHATFLGNNDDEAFRDYSTGQNGGFAQPPPKDGTVHSALTKTEPVHGDETLGLGSSTFLEGAPASRAAMQRRESESNGSAAANGLGRKKSLAQKIRGINNGPRRDYGPAGRITSPNGVYSPRSPDGIATPGGTKLHETNPFFNEFSAGDDRDMKKEGVTFVEPVKDGRLRSPSSPRRGFAGLERRVTSDGQMEENEPAKAGGGGFLSRVKSLKGGPRKPKAMGSATES